MNSCRLLGRVVFFVGAGLAAAASMIGTKRSPGAEILSPIECETFDARGAHLSCGARALYLWLRLLGCDVSYNEIEKRIPVGERGSSLAQLALEARQWTDTACVVKVQPSELDHIPLPAIAHGQLSGQGEGPGHYVVVVNVSTKAVVFIDGGRGLTQEVGRSDFEAFWSGYVLTRGDGLRTRHRYLAVAAMTLVGFCGVRILRGAMRRRRRLVAQLLLGLCALTSGCGLRSTSQPASLTSSDLPKGAATLTCSNMVDDLGVVMLGGSARAVFTLTNVGEKPVDLSLGRPSCSCLSADLSENRVEPHGSVQLALALGAAGERAGKQGGSVAVGVVGSDQARIVVQAVAMLEGMKTDPYSLPLPASLVGFSAPPIRGEIVFGENRRDSDVKMMDIVLTDSRKTQGDRLFELMPPVLGKVEKMESHLRRRFQIPVSIVVGARPEPRFYNVRLTYRIGERTADHVLEMLLFPRATTPTQTKAR